MPDSQAQQTVWCHQNRSQQRQIQRQQQSVQPPKRRQSVTKEMSLECARDLECARCARMFPAKRFLAQHLAPDKLKCQVCCKQFQNIGNLMNHVRVHTGEKPYTCMVCHKSFTQLSNLRAHVFWVHSGHTPYACDVCGRQYKRMSNLAKHRQVHDPTSFTHATSGGCLTANSTNWSGIRKNTV